MSHHQNAGQNPNINIANKCCEHATGFIYLGTAVATQKYVHDETYSRLNLAVIRYRIFYIYRNLTFKIFRKITVPVVLYGCET
jgi:hypothetical protein